MRIIRQTWALINPPEPEAVMNLLEQAARTCYKSEDRMGDYEKSKEFIGTIIKNGHLSVIEHVSLTVRIITDRGVSHELVRHRLAAYSQESTRYCNYGKSGEISTILPVWFYGVDSETSPAYSEWIQAMNHAESAYLRLLEYGQSPQQARTVLPNSLKTEIVMTANLREWRHVFTLRAANPKAHPQMRELMVDMLEGFKSMIPVVFDDIVVGESR